MCGGTGREKTTCLLPKKPSACAEGMKTSRLLLLLLPWYCTT